MLAVCGPGSLQLLRAIAYNHYIAEALSSRSLRSAGILARKKLLRSCTYFADWKSALLLALLEKARAFSLAKVFRIVV